MKTLNRHANPQIPMRYSRRGGARLGAGRPKEKDAGVSHAARERLTGREPVHVTLRLLPHVWQLRSRRCFSVIEAALEVARERFGLRVCGFSVQGNHLHLLCEAEDRRALSRGMQGLSIRLARGLNRLMGRRGRVFADRYHAHVLRTPREVRNALRYVAENTRSHAARLGRPLFAAYRDPYTVIFCTPGHTPSLRSLVGGRDGAVDPRPADGPAAVGAGPPRRLLAAPRTFLLRAAGRWYASQRGAL